LNHYIQYQYANTPHEKLAGQTPLHCFQSDSRPLRFAESEDSLRQAFVLYVTRRVSFDNVVSLSGDEYEVPRVYAGTNITLHRNLLENSLGIVHRGRLVRLSKVDKEANARAGRAKDEPGNETAPLPPKSSSQIAFERDFKPVIDPDGGFSGHPDSDKETI